MVDTKELYYQMIVEIEDYAILLLDEKGNVMNWNKGAEKIKGYTANEIVGKNFQVFYTEDDRAQTSGIIIKYSCQRRKGP